MLVQSLRPVHTELAAYQEGDPMRSHRETPDRPPGATAVKVLLKKGEPCRRLQDCVVPWYRGAGDSALVAVVLLAVYIGCRQFKRSDLTACLSKPIVRWSSKRASSACGRF
jgi:hypothetical protein